MIKQFAAAIAFAAAVSFALEGHANSIDVLVYQVGDSRTNDVFTEIASDAGSYDPNGDGALDWNLTFWATSGPTPDFSAYDVLMIPSAFAGLNNFNDSRLLSAGSAIAAARGSRTFLSGQDADWHYRANRKTDNGPRGFIINAVNWAASGTGLGIVSLTDGYLGSGNQWWIKPGSFLRDELLGYVTYHQEDSIIIPGSTAGFPVNEGLTSSGLSNWAISAHAAFSHNLPGYLSINDTGTLAGHAVTVVTEGLADGVTDGGDDTPTGPPAIPLPSLAALFALAAFWAYRQHR